MEIGRAESAKPRSPAPEVRIVEKRVIRVSKYLLKYLRHSSHELVLTLRPGG
jgi:hypothetical protein